MAAMAEAFIDVTARTDHLVAVLRVIAKHAEALADELALLSRKETEANG
jgi:hypothetical protein